MLIENVDQRSKDYGEIARQYRPGHADYTYEAKYGLRDYRGGGRSSARETAARVAAGAIARKVVPGLKVRGALIAMGEKSIDRDRWDWDFVGDPDNPFFSPDPQLGAEVFADYLDGIRKAGSSVGALIEVVAEGVPAGLGAPIYGKLDQDIAANLMSINAVKGVEIGDGFAAAAHHRRGERRRDAHAAMTAAARSCPTTPAASSAASPPASRWSARFAVKPTSSILTPRRSSTRDGNEVEVVDQGPPRPLRRHPRRADRRGDGRLRHRRPLSEASRADGQRGGA